MLSISEKGQWRPATTDDLENDCGQTHEAPAYRESNWRKKEREMTRNAANYWHNPSSNADALERLLWSQVNQHGVHG